MAEAKDAREFKFGLFIGDIDRRIRRSDEKFNVSPLDIIFERDGLNIYGSTIIREVSICAMHLVGEEGVFVSRGIIDIPWNYEYKLEDMFDSAERIRAARSFIDNCCEREINKPEGYKLIFWSLMILGVDDTDANEKLSLICDFAKMLNISNEEMMDMAGYVKAIYAGNDKEYSFKSNTVKSILISGKAKCSARAL